MPRSAFNLVYEAVSQRPSFVRKSDGLGRQSIHPLQRVIAALRIMAYGSAADAVDEYIRISESASLESLKQFAFAIIDEFGEEFLRSPTSEEMQRILKINTARGFPGMTGSIDWQHYFWKNCPTQLAGQYKGKYRKLTIVLEGIADGELPIWFLFYGLPGL